MSHRDTPVSTTSDAGEVSSRVPSILLAFVVLTASILGWIRIRYPPVLESWDWFWYDVLATSEPTDEQLEPYVVVLVDDDSLAQLGERWPMSRATWARLVQSLAESRPATVALTAWFELLEPPPSLQLAEAIVDQLDALDPATLPVGVSTILDEAGERLHDVDADRQLTAAVSATGKVILGMACTDSSTGIGAKPLPPWLRARGVPAVNMPGLSLRCDDLSMTYAELGDVVYANAGINTHVDSDGTIRRYPMYFAYQEIAFPSLATSMLSAAGVSSPRELASATIEFDGGMPLVRPFDWHRIRTISLIDVLQTEDADVLHTLLNDKRVFVGVSALGTVDTITLPGYPRVPAIYLHIIAAVGVENHTLVSTRSAALAWSVAISLLGLIALGFIVLRLPLRVTLPICILSCTGSIVLADMALERGVLITLIPWWVGVGGVLVVHLSVRLMDGRRHQQQVARIRGAFQHYVAPEVIDELLSHRDKLRLGGERQTITAFFTDVVGFTKIAERTEPAVLVKLLNEILSAMSDIVVEEGGIVDKYVGDSIVAMFGAPVAYPDHATRSCRAALRCQQCVDEIRAQFEKRGLPPIHIRVGLNSGLALVGNIGSESRFDFTMLGDTVNLASRLEGVNNVYGSRSVAGEQTFRQAYERIAFRQLDRVRVVGRDRAVSIYQPMAVIKDGVSDEVQARIDVYEAALARYQQRDFVGAIERFQTLAERGDRPARVMLARAHTYAESPPPRDWDGTFKVSQK